MAETIDQFSSALDAAAAVRDRKVSPLELVDAALERVDRLNPALNSVIWRNDDQARAEARKLGDDIANGHADLPPFAGVPIPIKDLTPVHGWPVTYGSYGAPEGVSDEGEIVTEALKKAGFILCGRTNTPEFGPLTVTENTRYGVTRNPWDTNFSPGGSSGGAGASVASGMFAVAHANDGGGSIRIPASCCGLVGLKPARGRVPSHVPGWQGMSIEGAVTRTVADTAAILDCISGPDPHAWSNAPAPEVPFSQVVGTDPGSLRVALLVTSALGMPIEPEPMAALERAGALFEQLGHKVFTIDTDVFAPDAIQPFLDVINTGFAEYEGIDWEKVEPHNKASYASAMKADSLTPIRGARAAAAPQPASGLALGTGVRPARHADDVYRAAGRRLGAGRRAREPGRSVAHRRRHGGVHCRLQHHRPAGDQPAASLVRGGTSDRRADRRRTVAGGAPAPGCLPARRGRAMVRPASARQLSCCLLVLRLRIDR